MAMSAFGVEDPRISKADDRRHTGLLATAGGAAGGTAGAYAGKGVRRSATTEAMRATHNQMADEARDAMASHPATGARMAFRRSGALLNAAYRVPGAKIPLIGAGVGATAGTAAVLAARRKRS